MFSSSPTRAEISQLKKDPITKLSCNMKETMFISFKYIVYTSSTKSTNVGLRNADVIRILLTTWLKMYEK